MGVHNMMLSLQREICQGSDQWMFQLWMNFLNSAKFKNLLLKATGTHKLASCKHILNENLIG